MMKRSKKNPDVGDPLSNSDTRTGSSELNATKPSLSSMKSMGLLLAVLMVASVMFSLSVVLRDPPSDGVAEADAASRFLQIRLHPPGIDSDDGLSEKKEQLGDINLVASSFDKESCLSRYEASLYIKESPFKQSSYLDYRLQRYEDLHRQCGPFTRSYNLTLDKLKPGDQSDGGVSGCRYVIWLNSNGELGNRMLSLASAFLYALLTNRVLLVEPGVDMADLFCEPFPNTSWFLPLEFPLKSRFNEQSLLRESGNSMLAYRHVNFSDQQKLFFCEESQVLLEETPWLIMKADSFFLPSLFSISSFKQELERLFPEKETAFYFLSQYLFHPTNAVWGLITRYYRTYLARADQRIGIYIEVSESGNGQFQYLVDQILACGTRYKLLPEVDRQRHLPSSQVLNQKSKAVFVSSSSPGYFESIRDIYWENPTVIGEIISVHKLSHKDYQKTPRNMEYKRAWAEIYLLSCTDVLVSTSSWSSLMDVAHGLGGLTPWVLNKAENGTSHEPSCVRARSIEPRSQVTLFQSCKD
ncbi:PREDICTED: fucosyltransferase 3-like [Camelina sativa]|uniref:Fucosyltransferase n=1 Tax=Camelina sativa TaxID=90675 RepID=A0ABM0WIF9_CAMSA|nr:PREDICTED: fucosyltransferase 3-like [Camelina sativa]